MKGRIAVALAMALALHSFAHAAEPNETFETRTVLAPGVLMVADVLTPGTAAHPNTLLGIRDMFGQIYFVDDNGSPLGDGTASGVGGVPTNSGSIDFAVSGVGDDFFVGSHSESGQYKVFVDVYDFFEELVDSFSEVRTLAPGVVHDFFYSDFEWIGGSYDVYIDNTLSPPTGGDVDFFTFTGLTPGAAFSARTADPAASGIDTILAWFDDDGAVLEVNDDDENLPGQLVSRIDGMVPVGGMLTFAVSGFGDNNLTGFHSENGAYELLLEIQSVALMGDYNGNNVVDAADYALYRNTFGQAGSGLAADGNGNGTIDPGDYTVWRANFGRTSGSALSGATAGLSSSAVPEPALLTMVLFVALSGLLIRRRPGPLHPASCILR